MEFTVQARLYSPQVIEMSFKLKEIFDEAKKDQRGKLFAAFGAIGAHLVTQKDLPGLMKVVGWKKPPTELAMYFENGQLSRDAVAAFEFLAKFDNEKAESWGSFMEFCSERFGHS